MNKNRFLNYARYDLTIHFPFYRSLALTTAVVMLAMTLFGFLFRWWMVKIDFAGGHYDYSVDFMVIALLFVMSVMHIVYFGCFNHPLRARQDRLKTLTLPVTNGDRFLWHSLLPLVGGALLLLLCLLLSDGLNALLSLLAGFDEIYSLTAGVFSAISLSDNMGFSVVGEPLEGIIEEVSSIPGPGMLAAFWLFNILSVVWVWSAYVYGNHVKYRYNLLWTTLGLLVLQAVLSLIFIYFAVFISVHEEEMKYYMQNWDMDTVAEIISGIFWTVDFIMLTTGVLLWRFSWKRFKNAQITTRLNR